MNNQIIVIGSGLAGVMTALRLAPIPVLLLGRAPAGEHSSSAWAQGGVAAALGPDDSPALHLADTLAAGDGLCDEAVASAILHAAPDTIADLAARGVAFDRHPDGAAGGTYDFGLEAAHARPRILHALGGATGRAIMGALIAAVRTTPFITLRTDLEARRLLTDDTGAIAGVLAAAGSCPVVLSASRVVLATGGVGGLYERSTNPALSTGHGLALAARAGAVLRDLEFVQFHPTGLDVPAHPVPLVSEAVRGAGAILIDDTGARFMRGTPGEELAPRDVVARAIGARIAAGHRVFLDARRTDLPRRFPALAALCRDAGLDPDAAPLPVSPAAHYHMGGVAVTPDGRAGVPGLWAVGEVASTGLHGANRLASNSLLEAAVCAAWAASSLAATSAPRPRPAVIPLLPPPPDPAPVRPVLSRYAGLIRDEAGLVDAFTALADSDDDAALVGRMIALAALRRRESRGAHARTDHPGKARPAHATLTLAEAEAERRQARRARLAEPLGATG